MGIFLSVGFDAYRHYYETPFEKRREYLSYGFQATTFDDPTTSGSSAFATLCTHREGSITLVSDVDSPTLALYDRLMTLLDCSPPDKILIQYRRTEKVELTVSPTSPKKLEVYHMSPIHSLCVRDVRHYLEVITTTLSDANGSLGCEAGDRVILWGETSWEWWLFCYVLWRRSCVPCTLYTTLPSSSILMAFGELQATAIFCSQKGISQLASLLMSGDISDGQKASLISLRACFYMEDKNQTKFTNDENWRKSIQFLESNGVLVLPFEKLYTGTQVTSCQLPVQEKHSVPTPSHSSSQTLDDLGVIMYTSGTTSQPKGVMITHRALSKAVSAFQEYLDETLGPVAMVPREVYLSYLPVAHIMEFVVESVVLFRGSVVSYGSPRTLTDITTRPCGDFAAFRPHVLLGVPRVLETIRKGIESRLPRKGTIRRFLFDTAVKRRWASLLGGNDHPYLAKYLFASAYSLFGGNLQLIIVGGGPLSSETHKIFQVITGGKLVCGYGLTETSAVLSVRRLGDFSHDGVGQILRQVLVGLRPVKEYQKITSSSPTLAFSSDVGNRLISYDVSDDESSEEKQKTLQIGEICVKSPMLAKGYYKQPKLTEEAFAKDGWFYTGDIGRLHANGSLSIVGRVKALAKNSLGEYIAMEALESVYSSNNLSTPNGICVVVNPYRNYIVALVVTDEEKATRFAKEKGVGLGKPWPEMLEDPKFHMAAAASLAETAEQAGRHPFECVKYVRVLNDEWTPENNMLTAAMKLKRSVLEDHYKDIINFLYSEQ